MLKTSVLALFLLASPSVGFAQDDKADKTVLANKGDAKDAKATGDPKDAKPGDKKEETPTKAAEDSVVKKPDATMGPTIPDDATEEEKAALVAYQRAYAHYNQESRDYQKTVNDIVDAKYKQRIAEINDAYNSKIDELSAVERARRVETIAAFENFIKRYPKNARFTPDAMFRLAELYFEKTNDDFLLADEDFQAQTQLYESGKIPDPPKEPVRDYASTIKTFRSLIAAWPDYRLLDGAYYLLAYCELQMGNDDTAYQVFSELIAKRPKSRFVPESWIRIGEYFFEKGDLDKARESYAQAMKFPKSRFYDKALYKLAWTNYRQDNFDKAIGFFKQLVEYSDAQEAKTGRSGSVLRTEAVQYIAISLAEEDWDLDGIKDDEFGLPRTKRYLNSKKPYEREVFSQLATYLFDNERFEETIAVIRHALKSFPTHEENPQLHEKLILALFRNDNTNEAFAERSKLGTLYGPGSPWFAAQEKAGNADGMRYASALVRDNLIQSATWFHEQAQNEYDEAVAKQDDAMLQSARKKFAIAARTYSDFLRKHPNDKDAFQWNFYYAETLFYSAQYQKAHAQYRVVRELDIAGPKFNEIQEQAAFNAVKSLENLVEAEIRKGKLPSKVLPQTAKENPPPEMVAGKIKAEPIPSLVNKYITAMDRYVVLGFKNKTDPRLDGKFAFQAAKLYYDFQRFPDARKRFDWIMANYSKTDLATYAASLKIETYRLEKDYENLSKTAKEVQGVLPEAESKKLKIEIENIELQALFKAAEAAYGKKDYETAIDKYLKLASRDKDKKYAAKALTNAAVGYEALGKYESAMKLYEKINSEFPKNDLASYALYRVAVNAERFFEFEKAADKYRIFYQKYAKKETPKFLVDALDFDYQKKSKNALSNMGVLLRDLQKYTSAARRFEEFVDKHGDDPSAGAVQWEAIIAWRKAKNTKNMFKAIEVYVGKYGSAKNVDRVFQALDYIADHHEKGKNEKKAKKAWQRIIDEYVRRGVTPGSVAAYYAAKAQFTLTEYEFRKWEKIQFKGKLKKQKKLLQQKIDGQKRLAPLYESVYAYGNLEWTLAAGFRTGNLFQRFAQALYDAEIPFKEGTDQWDVYRGQLDDIAIPLEDEAVSRYEKVIKKAKEDKIVNEWTKKTLDELNKYKPAEYPLYKEERREMIDRPLRGRPALDYKTYKLRKNPPPPEKKK